ncbi:alpha/beta hydrolase [Chloroflexi bacterium]|nr:alpha/beta hydrolase [Chloroflexota bacterium]
MPYADSNGYAIYYETEGSGAPLLLHHGLTMSIDDWRNIGYVEALKKDYRLILISPLGHGISDKPHTPEAYTSKQRVSDIVAVLDEVEIKRAQILGYSLGGRAALELVAYCPDRVISAAIGGIGPVFKEPSPMKASLESGVDSWIELVKKSAWPCTPEWESRARENDFEALLALLNNPMECLRSKILSTNTPTLFYIGDKDFNYTLVDGYVEDIPNSEKLVLKGVDHIGGFLEIDKILPAISKFLKKTGSNRQ